MRYSETEWRGVSALLFLCKGESGSALAHHTSAVCSVVYHRLCHRSGFLPKSVGVLPRERRPSEVGEKGYGRPAGDSCTGVCRNCPVGRRYLCMVLGRALAAGRRVRTVAYTMAVSQFYHQPGVANTTYRKPPAKGFCLQSAWALALSGGHSYRWIVQQH